MNFNQIHNWVNTALIAVVLVLVLVGGNQPEPTVVKNFGAGTRFPNGISADSTLPSAGQVRGTTATFTSTGSFTGAVTHTANANTFGGVTFHFDTQAFDTATTTVCSLQSPAATSTLEGGSARFSVSSTTASTVRIARAATAFATTTTIIAQSVGAGAQITIPFASSTPSNTYTDRVFAPSTWLVIGMEGGTGTFSPTGNCWAYWSTVI